MSMLEGRLTFKHRGIEHDVRVAIVAGALATTKEGGWTAQDLREDTAPQPRAVVTTDLSVGLNLIALYDPTHASDQFIDLANALSLEGVPFSVEQRLTNMEPPQSYL